MTEVEKDFAIRDLLTRLSVGPRGWVVVDHWEGDRCAIGIASRVEPRRLVYVNTYARAPGRFYFECESPSGPADHDFRVIASGTDVDFDQLLAAIEDHLRRDGVACR